MNTAATIQRIRDRGYEIDVANHDGLLQLAALPRTGSGESHFVRMECDSEEELERALAELAKMLGLAAVE